MPAPPLLAEHDFRALASSVDRSRTWGPGDERGALNFLTRSTVAAAAGEVRSGEVVSCADRRAAGAIRIETTTERSGSWVAVNETVSFRQHGALTAMTHFDALGHFFYDGLGYGGVTPSLLTASGVSGLDVGAASAGIVGRGVLLDLPLIAGVPYLDPETFVRSGTVRDWLRRVGVETRAGDLLYVRTGRPLAPSLDATGHPAIGGLDLDWARWLHDGCFALVVSDGGLDSPTPIVENVLTPWHVLMLTRMGVSLVDLADLEHLAHTCARLGRYTFLAVVSVLPLPKSTASPVNPLAVF